MQHPDNLLAEYYDRELSARHHREVEEHLASCSRCRAELGHLRHLSALLADCPVPDTFTLPERFRSQVILRLPRRQAAQASPLAWAWLAVPLALVCVLALLQALLAFSGALRWTISLAGWTQVDLSLPLAPLSAAIGSWGAFGDEITLSALSFLGLALSVFLYLASVLVFLPYAGWIAVLWRSAVPSDRREGR